MTRWEARLQTHCPQFADVSYSFLGSLVQSFAIFNTMLLFMFLANILKTTDGAIDGEANVIVQ